MFKVTIISYRGDSHPSFYKILSDNYMHEKHDFLSAFLVLYIKENLLQICKFTLAFDFETGITESNNMQLF